MPPRLTGSRFWLLSPHRLCGRVCCSQSCYAPGDAAVSHHTLVEDENGAVGLHGRRMFPDLHQFVTAFQVGTALRFLPPRCDGSPHLDHPCYFPPSPQPPPPPHPTLAINSTCAINKHALIEAVVTEAASRSGPDPHVHSCSEHHVFTLPSRIVMSAVLRRWVASWPRMRRRYGMPTFAVTKKERTPSLCCVPIVDPFICHWVSLWCCVVCSFGRLRWWRSQHLSLQTRVWTRTPSSFSSVQCASSQTLLSKCLLSTSRTATPYVFDGRSSTQRPHSALLFRNSVARV